MDSLIGASDEVRYNYLIQTGAKTKMIWLLQERDGMFAMMEDANAQEYIPVWPEEQYAKLNAADDWAEYQPEAMDLFEFNSWLKELEEDLVKIAAFPDGSGTIIPLDPLVIKKHLEEEYQRINPK